MEHTPGDLWRMVTENQCSCIIMLCSLREGEEKTCHRFWPKFQGKTETYGDFDVTQQSFDSCGDYNVTKLSVSPTGAADQPAAMVTLFHFTRWTEKNSPQNTTPLLEVIQEVNSIQMASGNKPIVVMCK